MTTGFDSVIVIAKEPRPGRVKTRLTPALTPEQAADVAAAALRDTLGAVSHVPARRHLLAFAGDPTGWLPSGWRHVPQPAGGLDERLAAAFTSAAAFASAAASTPAGASRPGPAVLVGMDTPQLRVEQLTAWNPRTHDACLGPAADGGFWAIGLADPSLAADALLGIPMSTARTGEAQLERLRALGLEVAILDTLTDVDTVDTAYDVARLVPHSRFAAALAAADIGRLGRTA